MALDWQHRHQKAKFWKSPSEPEQEIPDPRLKIQKVRMSSLSSRPPLQSHNSFAAIAAPSNCSTAYYQTLSNHTYSSGALSDLESLYSQQLSSGLPEPLSFGSAYGDSTPVSPAYPCTSISESSEHEDLSEDDGEDARTEKVSDQNGLGSQVAKSAEERRAEKRKMKRFRLTHNQTRFLLSDFARQPHPDAAQRERLSREVPGLSPRQVQVWFQNRRAKLKRLTNDDRERMMESRAVPEDFDMTQALRSPFGAQSFCAPSYQSSTISPSFPPPASEGGYARPLIIRRSKPQSEDESLLSASSSTSNFGSLYTPPSSLPPSVNLSPVPSVEHRTNIASRSDRPGNPFVRSSNAPTSFHPRPNIPKLQLHDRVSRVRAESLTSPSRSGLSYSGSSLDYPGSPSSDGLASSTFPIAAAPEGYQNPSHPHSTCYATIPSVVELQTQSPSLYSFPGYVNEQIAGPNSAPLSMPQDLQLPIPPAAPPHVFPQTNYEDAFGTTNTYQDNASISHAGLTQQLILDDYPQPYPQSLPQRTSRSVTDEGGGHLIGLQPGFGPTRRRSFTHPAHQQRSR